MSSLAMIFDSYHERDIDYEISCHNCIRPASRMTIGINMSEKPTCKHFDGFTCCNDACNYWITSHDLCILHGKIHFRHEGFYRLQCDAIYRFWRDNKQYIKKHITRSKHVSIKQVLEILDLKTAENLKRETINSESFIFRMIYSKAISSAAKKHWMIKQVFAQHLKPGLYQMEMVWN